MVGRRFQARVRNRRGATSPFIHGLPAFMVSLTRFG